MWSLAVQGAEAAEYHKYAQHLTNVVSLLQMTPSQRELERKRDIEAIEIQRNTVVQREGKIMTVLPCHHCKKKRDRASLKTCARCGVTRYCDRACQQADWSAHKKSCKKGATEAADAAEAEVLR